MRKRNLVLYIASSLDGYIATEDENLDWLLQTEGEGDNGYSAFYQMVDTILIGRVTYDWIMEHEHGKFPYQGKECYVFSKIRREDNEFVKFVHEDAVSFTKKLMETESKNQLFGDESEETKKIWLVGGGKLIEGFIKEKLVDEIIVSMAPVLLGKGIPLFHQQEFQTLLRLEDVKRYGQFVEMHYIVL